MGFGKFSFYGVDMDGDGDMDRDDDIRYEIEMDEFDRINKLGIYEESSDSSTDDDVLNDLEEELEDAGLDICDLQDMDIDERIEAIEESGLDPHDFDDLF